MHLTLKKEATEPASKNFLKQQERFDRFLHIYNQERPHQALGMKYPAKLYMRSSRPTRDCPTSSTPSTTTPSP
jgi:putative transposase